MENIRFSYERLEQRLEDINVRIDQLENNLEVEDDAYDFEMAYLRMEKDLIEHHMGVL